MNIAHYRTAKRWHHDAGIAIGPILFIIAILAILAAAIAAGSGSFTSSSQTEGNRTKSAGLISVGESLKIGMDRLVMENGIVWGGWNINALSATSNQNDLFAPAGGGISSPSSALAADPGNDAWYYPQGHIGDLGDPSQADQLAVLNVTEGVCNEVNNRVYGQSESPAATVGSGSVTSSGAVTFSAWPTNLDGKTLGCFAAGGDYYFFQVLFIQ
jgi:hypothetical protein